MNYSPLWISMKAAVIGTIFTFFAGIFVAYKITKIKRCRGLIDGILTLPMVLPPTVVGFLLLLLFGRNSLVGKLLDQMNIHIVFNFSATVIASAVVSFPLMYRTALGAFEQMDQTLIHAAFTLGLSEWKIFWRIVVPNTWPGILAGTILAFARAIGEFGATIMIAGNIPGKTQTMAVAVYTAVQAGNRELAYQWVMIIMLISFTTMFVMNYWNKRARN